MDNIEFFDSIYKIYDKVRPGYPSEMFDDIFKYKNVGFGSRVFEIGIGTGKATQPFVDKQCQIASVEPGKKMARYMQKKYIDYIDFSCYNFTFEKYMGMNNTFDMIYSGTAFHRIDEQQGYEKVFKLLKSKGAFVRFAYHAGEDITRPELAREIRQLYVEYMNSSEDYKGYTLEDVKTLSSVAEKYGFINNEYKVYHFTKDFSADEYIKLLSTYPDHMEIAEEKRKEFFNKIKNTIKNHGGIITAHYLLDLHLSLKP